MIFLCKFFNREMNNSCEATRQHCVTDSRSPIDCGLIPVDMWTLVQTLELNRIHLNNQIDFFMNVLKKKISQNDFKERNKCLQ